MDKTSTATQPDPTSFADQLATGKRARDRVARSAHGTYEPAADRDPLGIIEQQNEGRFEALVPLRMARMSQDPFAFYRGTAALQAADLASGVDIGHYVVASGDAHLSNFGVYAARDRALVFDLNDFDEAAPAPWEWDVKRLVTSMLIASRANGLKPKTGLEIAQESARAYRYGIHRVSQLPAIDRYYLRQVVEGDAAGLHRSSRKAVEHTLKAAQKRTSQRVAAKIMEVAPDGSQMIREDPPKLFHVEPEIAALATQAILDYRATASPDINMLLSQYQLTDVARRVVGVGSVATRCYIAVFTGPHGEPLILQMKEAGRSVLDQFGGLDQRPDRPVLGIEASAEGGQRVVAFQRILQSTSDPFLGYIKSRDRGFYIRQFRDFNASFDIATLSKAALADYGRICGLTLARAHAQSPRAGVISGYLGKSPEFDRAVTRWAVDYEEQSRADFDAFTDAIAAGRFPTTDIA